MVEQNEQNASTATAEPGAEGDAESGDEVKVMAKVQAALDKVGLSSDSTPEASGEAGDGEQQTAAGKGEGEVPADESKGQEAKPEDESTDSLDLTPRQRQAMKELDLTEEDVAPLGEKAGEWLQAQHLKLNKKMGELGRLQQRLEAGNTGDEGSNADAPDAAESSPGASGKLAFGEDDLDQGDDGTTPGLAKLNDMAGRLAALEKRAQGKDDQEQEATVDGFFAGLWRKGEKDEDVTDFPQFGKGPWSDLDEASPEHAARKEILKEAAAIRKGYAFSHEDLSVEDSLHKGLAIVAQDQFREADQKRLAEAIKKRRKGATQRPGQRRSHPVEQTDDEKALAKVGAAMDKIEGFREK